MVEVKVNPGVCGFVTLIKVDSEDMQLVTVKMSSGCQYIQALAKELGEVEELDGYTECFSGFGEGQVCELAKKHCKHAACPVPTAIIKGIEAACGLALPRDVEFHIEKS